MFRLRVSVAIALDRSSQLAGTALGCPYGGLRLPYMAGVPLPRRGGAAAPPHIKADLALEKRRHHLDLAATSTSTSASTSSPEEEARGSGAAAFAPAQMAEITQIVRVVEEVLGSQACLPHELLPPPSLLLLP